MRFLPLMFLLFVATAANAQTGPWAKYDADLKGGALVREASGGNLAEVRSILQGGADPDWGATGGESTPLMSAAMAGHADVVAALIAAGADPTLRWKFNGKNALELARMNGHADVVALLQGASQGLPPPGVRPANAGNVAPVASRGGWPAFGRYRVGDRVQWRQANGWFGGTVSDVGPAGGSETYTRQYRIADPRWAGDGEWHAWGEVAGPAREPFWTGFFVGDWSLGEVMAVNDRRDGGDDYTEFAYHAASDALRVNADGSYAWKPGGGAEIRGRWIPAPDGPGVVLQRGAGGKDWTLRNETNAIEENIRRIQSARLSADGSMSIAAKRPMR